LLAPQRGVPHAHGVPRPIDQDVPHLLEVRVLAGRFGTPDRVVVQIAGKEWPKLMIEEEGLVGLPKAVGELLAVVLGMLLADRLAGEPDPACEPEPHLLLELVPRPLWRCVPKVEPFGDVPGDCGDFTLRVERRGPVLG